MIGRAERRRLARAAIERYEYQHANDQLRVEAAELRAERAEHAEREQAANLRGMAQRLDDANAELARWGLEPVTRDGAESDEHPARYRRASDWRTYRSGEELVELLERSGIDPDGPVPDASPRSAPPHLPTAEGRPFDLVARYESDAPAVSPLDAPVPERLAALRRQRDEALTGVGELSAALREAEEDRLRVMRELGDALTAASEAEAANVDLLNRLNAHRDSSAALADAHADAERARAMATELGLERDALSAELIEARATAADPGQGWIELAEFEAQRTEAERLERLNDRLTAEVARLTLLQENLTPLPPAKGDVITVNLRDGRTQRCTVLSVMPVGDLGFSLSLEPESPPL